jgi:hypothetical protein
MYDMDKSEEFFEETGYNSTKAALIQDLLVRLKNIANCFRRGFSELTPAGNSSFNETMWETDYSTSSWPEEEGDIFVHTIVLVSIFCCIALLLVIRSSRGGSCTSCKAASDGETTVATKLDRQTKSSYQIVPVV